MTEYRRLFIAWSRGVQAAFMASCLASCLVLASCANCESESSGTAAGASEKHAPNPRAARVEVAAVRASQPTLHLERPGEVEGAREAQLASALGGFVEAVKVADGESVARNQTIAFVDTSVHHAQAKLTKIEVEDAERELARLETLGKSIASARVDAARTRLERARAQHALSQTRQARAVIRAPFAGVIVDLSIERGEVVVPGAPVARLIELDPIIVAVSVADRDIALLRVGGPAKVTTAATPEPVVGTIQRIEPAADLETRTFEVQVQVENTARTLLPGMIAKVAFDSKRDSDVLLLPQDFVVTRLDGNGVFVVDDQRKARWRPLELGALIGTQVEIVSGLQVGERVVVLGHRGLSDGDELLINREGVCCEDGRIVYHAAAGGQDSPGKPHATNDEGGAEDDGDAEDDDSRAEDDDGRAEDDDGQARAQTGTAAPEKGANLP